MNNDSSPERQQDEPVAPAPVNDTPSVPQGPTKQRKKWLIPLIVAGVFVVLGGVGALGYKYWYQMPQKVMADALMHALEAKSATYTGSFGADDPSGTKVTIDFNGADNAGAHRLEAAIALKGQGKTYEFKAGAVLAADGTIYAKVANVDVLLKEFRQLMTMDNRAAFDSFIAKVNDRWIKISNDKLKEFSKELAKGKTCLQDAYKTLQNDNSYSSELVTLYERHPFVRIDKELGAKDGSLGYEVIQSPAETKAFSKGLQDTKLFKQLKECDEGFTVDLSEQVSNSTSETMEVWVSRWSHEITKISMSVDAEGAKGNMIIEPKWNTGETIEAPKDTTDVETLVTEAQQLSASLFGSFTFSDPAVGMPADPFSSRT